MRRGLEAFDAITKADVIEGGSHAIHLIRAIGQERRYRGVRAWRAVGMASRFCHSAPFSVIDNCALFELGSWEAVGIAAYPAQ